MYINNLGAIKDRAIFVSRVYRFAEAISIEQTKRKKKEKEKKNFEEGMCSSLNVFGDILVPIHLSMGANTKVGLGVDWLVV